MKAGAKALQNWWVLPPAKNDERLGLMPSFAGIVSRSSLPADQLSAWLHSWGSIVPLVQHTMEYRLLRVQGAPNVFGA